MTVFLPQRPFGVGPENLGSVGDRPLCLDAGECVVGTYPQRPAVDGNVDVAGSAHAMRAVKVDVQ